MIMIIRFVICTMNGVFSYKYILASMIIFNIMDLNPLHATSLLFAIPPMSDQAVSDFCSFTSRKESGTKSTCAAAKSSVVKVGYINDMSSNVARQRCADMGYLVVGFVEVLGHLHGAA